MVDTETVRQLAFSLPGTVEQPHFEKISFRINKKIFATLSEETRIACLKLSETDQSVFCSMDKKSVYPVGNKWGKQGWTFFDLHEVNSELFADALATPFRPFL